MAYSFVTKQLVASNLVTRSIFNSFSPATSLAVSNRRGFATSFSGRTWMRILNNFRHTCVLTRATGERKDFPKCKSDPAKLFIGDGLKFLIKIPGIEKKYYTSEGVRVFIDLGLGEDNKDFDDQKVETKLDKKDEFTLWIQGYVQKHDVRRNFNARVNLEHKKNYEPIDEPIKTEIHDGILKVTIPWVPQK